MQALGGGGMVPVCAVDPGGFFPPEKRGQALRCSASPWSVAPVVGPTLGGWLSDNLSWQWCFLINAPGRRVRDAR